MTKRQDDACDEEELHTGPASNDRVPGTPTREPASAQTARTARSPRCCTHPPSEARVGIQDEKGHAIAGFARADCDRILFNDVAYTVKWKGKSDVSVLSGRPVRLRLCMRSAKLYAFQFLGGKWASQGGNLS